MFQKDSFTSSTSSNSGKLYIFEEPRIDINGKLVAFHVFTSKTGQVDLVVLRKVPSTENYIVKKHYPVYQSSIGQLRVPIAEPQRVDIVADDVIGVYSSPSNDANVLYKENDGRSVYEVPMRTLSNGQTISGVTKWNTSAIPAIRLEIDTGNS